MQLPGAQSIPDTWRLELEGQVQGVGFRPFVFRLARELDLHGYVQNRLGSVHIVVQGRVEALLQFENRLISDAPILARPSISIVETVDSPCYERFQIYESSGADKPRISVPPDCFMCPDCRAEQRDPGDRRYRYPFINCTQCGPRYTLIECLPYDRPNTSMSGFPLCPECLTEYSDPCDRRFHAEPIGCPNCGPRLEFESAGHTVGDDTDDALGAALAELHAGRIIAVKGIGGYHLMCDAANELAVARLRHRKQRPRKPLAVMFPFADDDVLALVRQSVHLNEVEAAAVRAPARPIVLAKIRKGCPLARNVAPGLDELGVFLPYSPLHQLLLDDFGAPLVATSGNVSGEPVLTDNAQAAARLDKVANAFLHHNRPIVRPADDPVVRNIDGAMRPLRLGRGIAPLEVELPWQQAEPVLCLGGHLKATVTLSWDRRAVVSPHIGDMDSPRSLEVFEQLLSNLQELYGVSAARLVCDAHPGYASHRWARSQDALPVSTVWHHRAHASALAGEFGLTGLSLIFAWDGVGYGEDSTLWGGEALLGQAGSWRRVCSLRSFRPPGGDRAGREPWRSAAALLWESGDDRPAAGCDDTLARQAWEKDINCPRTSAAGRLFDAAAALVCRQRESSYEAEGPMRLESLCRRPGNATHLPLYKDASGVLRSNWAPLLDQLADEHLDPVTRAENFHASMANVILDQANAMRTRYGVVRVGLTGGVFQNRVLATQAAELLRQQQFDVFLNRKLPCNDGALSFGQAVEWAASQQARESA